MSGWRERAEALEDIYGGIDFDILRSDIVQAIGEDQAKYILHQICMLDFRMWQMIGRLRCMADADDASAADGAEGR
ncbi:MAG: hypothetical protein SOW20_07855 [Berryella intestinalis]|uniref:hypothetical protein n=1 Tax=Berryella intestinalis TaxID=1531429 RepID=UPI002A763EAF|nr:hypothetical protein [Berryella intestinalis]MDY3129918.1 hypothetical protein [Berryella intestinalis]